MGMGYNTNQCQAPWLQRPDKLAGRVGTRPGLSAPHVGHGFTSEVGSGQKAQHLLGRLCGRAELALGFELQKLRLVRESLARRTAQGCGPRPMKDRLLSAIRAELRARFDRLTRAAKDAHAAATDPGSKAESKYDTRSLEASYLAAGQARQLEDLARDVSLFDTVALPAFAMDDPIDAGALVEADLHGESTWFLLAPAAARQNHGTRPVAEEDARIPIVPIDPSSERVLSHHERVLRGSAGIGAQELPGGDDAEEESGTRGREIERRAPLRIATDRVRCRYSIFDIFDPFQRGVRKREEGLRGVRRERERERESEFRAHCA